MLHVITSKLLCLTVKKENVERWVYCMEQNKTTNRESTNCTNCSIEMNKLAVLCVPIEPLKISLPFNFSNLHYLSVLCFVPLFYFVSVHEIDPTIKTHNILCLLQNYLPKTVQTHA